MRISIVLFFVLFLMPADKVLLAQQPGRYVVKSQVSMKAIPFPLGDVKLLPGTPFYVAMQKNAEYLLSLDADRFLHRWRTNAGLKAKAPLYGGWEQTSSHMLGHYLSALALEYAASGNKKFLDKTNYVVDQLEEIQQARGTGYIGGIPGEDTLWSQVISGRIHSSGFDLNGAWVPWYMLHKVWDGLIDAYLYTGNIKAKKVVALLSDWAVNEFSGMPDTLFQKMLETEFGGMNESLAEVYAITGNKKYLQLAEKFNHKKILEPLANNIDQLGGLHANTQIPKILGAARQYELTGNKQDYNGAEFFFNAVVADHSYANGGNSNYESFNRAGKFKNALSANTSETCNTYNMLKLDKHLFTWEPSVALADYYERAIYNHILASQNPENGMMCYYVSLQSGTQKVFSTPYESFWCCVGTGIENHSKYAEDIYFKTPSGGLFVNLFIPSVLNWQEKKVVITQENNFPGEAFTKLKISTGKVVEFSLQLRCPSWSTNGMQVLVNGVDQKLVTKAGSYATLSRKWKNGDEIELRFDMHLRTEAMQDDPSKIAVFYGPVLMAGLLGTEKPGVQGVPVLVTNNKPVNKWLQRTDADSLRFTTVGAAMPNEVSLKPFYSVNDQRYIVYWDQCTQQQWKDRKAAYEAEILRLSDLEKRTVDLVRFGEQQSEKDHDLVGENTGVGSHMDRKFRDAPNGGWFSFKVKVTDADLQLINTYNGGDGGNRAFEIFADGIKIGEEDLKGNSPGKYIEKSYDIPKDLTNGKESVTIKFQGLPHKIAGAFFESRIIKR